jgi:hypothetical protein
MPNPLNAAFLNNPGTFINNANHAVCGHDNLAHAMVTSHRHDRVVGGSPAYHAGNALGTIIDTTKLVCFDFRPYRRAGLSMAVMTPVIDPNTPNVIPPHLASLLHTASSNPIRGYWFPYIALTPQQHGVARRNGSGPPSVMGWVDIPMHAPAHSFAFTGSMQGCHIVVALSPANPLTHFRVYHYPSPGTYWQTEGNMAFNHWPSASGGRPVAWLDDTMYAFNAPLAVDAFNFLHHNGANWVLHTQKLERQTEMLTNFWGTNYGAVVLFHWRAVSQIVIPTAPMSMGTLFGRAQQWRAARGLGTPS